MSGKLLSLDDMAKILGMPRDRVEMLCSVHAIPATLVIGSWMIYEDELEQWRRECEDRNVPRNQPPLDDDPM